MGSVDIYGQAFHMQLLRAELARPLMIRSIL